MKKQVFIYGFFILIASQLEAQTAWSLRNCIDYALQQNINLQQSALNVRINKLQEQQAKWDQYPNVNGGFSNGYSVGRSIDPTSNQFINQGYYYNGLNLSSNVLLFGWYQKKYAIAQSKLETDASTAQYEQLQNDIALNIATGYLRILLARAQVGIAQQQLASDKEQRRLTAISVNAGQLPALNLAQMDAQLATDSSTLVATSTEASQSLLDLKAILNMDMQQELQIETPTFSNSMEVQQMPYASAQEIYLTALQKQSIITYNKLKTQSAQQQIKIAEANKYPQISLGWNAGTNFASSFKQPGEITYIGEAVIGSFTFQDTTINITRPNYEVALDPVPYFKQYGNNFRQTLTLNANVPIFNGYSNKLNIERAKINMQNLTLTQKLGEQKLQQDIYRAYADANNSMQKHIAAIRNQQAAQTALDMGIQRLRNGMSNTLEYTTLQNNLSRAKATTISQQYDYIFKTKVLDFYAGKSIEL